jgi:hypothetical protein
MGSVKCIFYDIDDSIIATPILKAGDASFTFIWWTYISNFRR